MADQETGNVAALAIRTRSPDTAGYLHYGINTSGSDDEIDVVATDNKQGQVNNASKMKENMQNILNGSLKISSEKHDRPQEKINGLLNKDASDDLGDIYISDEVLKQLRSQTDDKEKKYSKQRRKIAKSQRKTLKTSGSNNKDEPDTNTKVHAKKILKPALRRRSTLSTSKSQFTEHKDTTELPTNNLEEVGNKAENNNWMVDDEISTERHINVVTASFHTKSNSAYLDTIIESSENLCLNCKEIKGVIDPVTDKEYSFKRADSSDDSGCFSNQSLQSINSPSAENRERQLEGVSAGGRSAVKSSYSSANQKLCTSSTGLCSACGNEPQGHGSGLCKTCIGRIKHDGIRIGALGELRAYAQSIADSVKKILSISPRESEEVLHPSLLNDGGDENKKGLSQTEDASATNIPALQKCKTHISLGYIEEARTKSILNKSFSFDGRVAAHLEDNNRRSPMYWISQEKPKATIQSSTIAELDEDKMQQALENASDHSFMDGDYFPSSGKEIKHYINHDDDKSGKLERDKAKKRSYTKQLSCVERVRTGGDSRGNSFQQVVPDKKNVKDEHKKTYELQRSKSRISRPANPDADNCVKDSQKYEDEMNALNIFRLKVIHEGSPVDPLYTVQRGKAEDAKDRRAMLMRSATAPNKNHMPKKDTSTEDKSNAMKNAVKVKRSNTKLTMKSNTSPTLIKEENSSEDVQEKKQILYDPQPDSWWDDTSVMAVTSFIRKRSTSYDGRRSKSSKRGELHRSISRSATDRDDKGHKQRRQAPSNVKAFIKKNGENEGGYSAKIWQPLRCAIRTTEDNHADVSLPFHAALKRESSTDNYRYHALEPSDKDFIHDVVNDLKPRIPPEEEHTEVLESPNKSSYFDGVGYYSQPKEQQFSPTSKELVYIGDRNATSFGTENYYCDTEDPGNNNQLVSDKGLKFDSPRAKSVFEEVDDEETYHNDLQKYGVTDISPEKDGQWYISHSLVRARMGRDRSHESKSSTSFHIVTTAKSSHSDVALMKHQGNWEHPSSRRQSMYSETDVDTGLIYHFAKRQTTRAHVPAYHDLTSASKDIYTMSGDVSTSASSNSAISTKSEVSDNVYTGGFFTHDPFYDNDTKVSSSSSSADSSSHLYFEHDNGTKRDPSELDIYTGAIFSSSQNALSLERTGDANSTNGTSDALKDGSTNNSTRPVSRISRRLRYRPHIDVIKFKSTDSASEFLSKSIEANREYILCNISNNSNNWCGMDDFDNLVNQGAVVKQSEDPAYTDYETGMKPVFQERKIEKKAPVVDLLKYERLDNSSNSVFFKTPTEDNADTDDVWYSGYSRHRRDDSPTRYAITADQSAVKSALSWQQNDDYYRSAQRPTANKTNNCIYEGPEQALGNTNNNRFEDIYTGFFESPKTKNYIPEQTHNIRKSPSDSWYADQPKRSYTPMGFYEQDQMDPTPTSRSTTADYESQEGAYSSSSAFGQTKSAHLGSSPYMSQSSWCEYEKSQMASGSSYSDDDDDDEPPRFRQSSPGKRSLYGEKYSYFPYVTSENPADGSYMYDNDNDNTSFDQRFPSPESEFCGIKKVGGIVCRENVANKEDYAEDINRDLEQGAWAPFNFRHEEKARYQEEVSSSRPELVSKVQNPVATSNNERLIKHLTESSYNQNRIYDDLGAGHKWREMAKERQLEDEKKKDPSPLRAFQASDAKKQDYAKTGLWNPPDQIPERARGKRPIPSAPKPPALDGSKASSSSSNVISSVTSTPSRLINYIKKWW